MQIEDYRLISNLRTAALMGRDGLGTAHRLDSGQPARPQAEKVGALA